MCSGISAIYLPMVFFYKEGSTIDNVVGGECSLFRRKLEALLQRARAPPGLGADGMRAPPLCSGEESLRMGEQVMPETDFACGDSRNPPP